MRRLCCQSRHELTLALNLPSINKSRNLAKIHNFLCRICKTQSVENIRTELKPHIMYFLSGKRIYLRNPALKTIKKAATHIEPLRQKVDPIPDRAGAFSRRLESRFLSPGCDQFRLCKVSSNVNYFAFYFNLASCLLLLLLLRAAEFC